MRPTFWILLKLSAVIGLVFMSGCAAKYGPGQLARDWSCKMREMQIRPLFPPREDFHVGDLYWLDKVAKNDAQGYCPSGQDVPKDFVPIPLHVAYFPEVTRQADAYYKSRPDFPRVSTSAGTVTWGAAGLVIAPAIQSTDATVGSSTLFTQGAANRTRIVGFPDFMSVKVDKASLGAIIPIQGMFTPFGLSSEDIDEASISIPVAESYAVPIATALGALTASPTICEIPKYISTETVPANGLLNLVTEVYYTRAIDINIQSKSALALSIARDRQNATTNALPATATTGIVTPGTAASGPQTTITLQQMAGVTGGMLKILEARNNLPGVSFGYEQGRSSTISMRRVFDRPVAIGYRAVAVGIDNDAGGMCRLKIVAQRDADGNSITGGLAPATVGGIGTSLQKEK